MIRSTIGDDGAEGGGVTGERRRPGRRPGSADTRGDIVAAARKIFAEKGFDKATIRGIAREAGVDPALVHHYFDTKEGIFVAALQLPVDPSKVLPLVIEGPREQIGERVVRFVLTLTADAQAREPILALMRSAMTNDKVVAMIREFMTHAVIGRVATGLGVPLIRMEAAFAQMFGVILMRYVLRVEPVASVDAEELVALLAPTIQRYLGEA
ncbi:TetR family transcriptional regulator [Sphaerisporangium siamense]|uniref:AcrR family transcriptional regulator n=1 Tax=Sphaerisporangium siamense TaxID=795645 RepID=A0A7W7D4M3_9ACTN|nr:TetR family transcriptional regulator [Sphaerisporangium siamense]MBB4700244.1 AcrR family transcriptional regulator [Sphaerisporangium siamense]GII84441.1 TetR family transcriptional regulator [Sphaerisporangium siamense]